MAFTGSRLQRETVTMILAGGQGNRLHPLTQFRSKPSVPFGGKYRIIDFALSNCLNSGLRKIYVLTQYKSDSLNQHLYEAWNIFNPELNEFIYSVPPQQKTGDAWYQGTGDAIFQNLNLLKRQGYSWCVVLGGDHIYRMDYMKMLQYHIEKKADLSISNLIVPKEQASRFGVIEIDEDYHVLSFIEKPDTPPEIPGKSGFSFVNMGIYVFNIDSMIKVIEELTADKTPNLDFGKHIIPHMVEKHYEVRAFRFEDDNNPGDRPYWVDVGTIDSYYKASMDLLSVNPEFNLYDSNWPLRTRQYQSPPAKTLSHEGERVGRALNSIVTDGTIISGGLVERSILGPSVRVNSYSYITDSIIMSNCNIGRHTRIRRAIIDKDVHIPEHEEIGFDIETDKKRFTVTETGIVVIPKDYKFN
ncbi:MAG: glucose-1-phosphate adenylyltransferase [Ignavibacteriae bacterium]|nr:MAG: glucose-1-phosphate adenylyltransferase [Ignavibacteriota bacterium]